MPAKKTTPAPAPIATLEGDVVIVNLTAGQSIVVVVNGTPVGALVHERSTAQKYFLGLDENNFELSVTTPRHEFVAQRFEVRGEQVWDTRTLASMGSGSGLSLAFAKVECAVSAVNAAVDARKARFGEVSA